MDSTSLAAYNHSVDLEPKASNRKCVLAAGDDLERDLYEKKNAYAYQPVLKVTRARMGSASSQYSSVTATGMEKS